MPDLHTLPPELRNKIYTTVLSSSPPAISLALAHTSRSLRHEFRPLYQTHLLIPWRKATSYLTTFMNSTSPTCTSAKTTINVDPTTTPALFIPDSTNATTTNTAAFIDVLPILRAAQTHLPPTHRLCFVGCADENGPRCRHRWLVCDPHHAPETALVGVLFNELRAAPFWTRVSRVLLWNRPGRFGYVRPVVVVREECKEAWMELVEPVGVGEGLERKGKGKREGWVETRELYAVMVWRWLRSCGVGAEQRVLVGASKVWVTWEGSEVSWCRGVDGF